MGRTSKGSDTGKRIRGLLEDISDRDWESGVDGEIRLALLGLGLWTREQVIPAIDSSEYCRATTVISSSLEKARSVVDSHETIECGLTYDQFQEGVKEDAYDAVYICTPNATHLDFVIAAADLGKNVLCEKPMEVSVERANRIVDACEDRGMSLMIAYRMQTEPAIRRTRELVRAGVIGEPVHGHAWMTQRMMDRHPDPDQWRLDPELSGGCSLIDIGLYPLNTLRFVIGAEVSSVWGRTWSGHEAFSEVDERVEFHAEFSSGFAASCAASHNAHQSSALTIIGSDGMIEVQPVFHPWEDRSMKVTCHGTSTDISFEQVDQMTEEFDYFADRLLSGSPIEPDGQHGLRDIELIEAIYEAAETGRQITV